MKYLTRTALFALSLSAVGCFPDERLWWSPDGTQLAVLTPTGLRFSDPEGNLSEATNENVKAAAWLSDNSGVVVLKQTDCATWEAAKALGSAAEAKRIEDLAKGIPELAAALLKATDGDEHKLEGLGKSLKISDPTLLGLAFQCALQTHPEALKAALATHATTKLVKDLLETKPTFTVSEIAVILRQDDLSFGPPKPVVRSLFPLGAPVPSPSHDRVAFAAGKDLWIANYNRYAFLKVTDANLGPCAWTPDGRSLVYLTPLTVPPADDTSLVVAKLCRRTVVDGAGSLLKDTGDQQTPKTCPAATTLATVAVSGPQRLAVLSDRQVLFTSRAATFPMAAATKEEAEQLFSLLLGWHDGAAPPARIKVDPALWSGTFQHFVVSPDGNKVALVDGSSDAVAVLELATGKLGIVSPPRGRKCRTLPAWRSNDELSFAALPDEKSGRPEVMLLKLGAAARVISAAWPAELVQPLLEAPDTPAE